MENTEKARSISDDAVMQSKSASVNLASQGINDINKNVNQSASVAKAITGDIFQITREAGDMANSNAQLTSRDGRTSEQL